MEQFALMEFETIIREWLLNFSLHRVLLWLLVVSVLFTLGATFAGMIWVFKKTSKYFFRQSPDGITFFNS